MASASNIIEWLLLFWAVMMSVVMVVVGGQIIHGAVTGKWNANDLVIGKNGRISDEKIWTHLVKAVIVFAMIKDASSGHPDIQIQGTGFLLCAAHEVVIRWLANRENPLGGIFGERRKSSVAQTVTETTPSGVKTTTTAPLAPAATPASPPPTQ